MPDYLDEACHQNVGTFPNKRLVLDNDDVIEVFDKFWKYTTVTNTSGDYMLYGIPTGNHTLHMDVDLSDIGLLSQRPTDMIFKGYNINQFESPTKFKKDTNLNSLAQIKSQDVGVFVYPFWGDSTDNPDNIAVTRCDIQVDYKFEPTCIFIGSIITDTGSNAIGKNCAGTDSVGKMSDLVAGEGSIEMIRKTIDNKVEEFQIKGNRVIDGDGVWCYQIPMNLDYVMTDEFGNLVPTDNPDKGIPTRARVRFRISLDDAPSDNTARKRCKYLVPNNPRLDAERFPVFTADEAHEPDYEFGTNTREESYCDLFWNKVYSVKNYIPRIQKNNRITNRKHTGIKLINHYGDNNPMPYNNLSIKLSFTYRFICVLTKIFILLVGFLNNIITLLGAIPCKLAEFFREVASFFRKMRIRIRAFRKTLIDVCLGCPIAAIFDAVASIFEAMTPSCIAISSEFCTGDVTHAYTFYPGCGKNGLARVIGNLANCVWNKTVERHDEDMEDVEPEDRTTAMNRDTELYNCVESQLAEDNDATSFNFQNDWINGTLYAPLWFRKITPKRSFLFGLFKRRAKDEWCSADHVYNGFVRIFHPCAVDRLGVGADYTNYDGGSTIPRYMTSENCDYSCHEKKTVVGLNYGLIRTKQTMLGQTVYYYKPVEYDATTDGFTKEYDEKGFLKILFATDIILLGSLNDCDLNGVPQFFKSLESTTYKLPPNMLFTDNVVQYTMNEDGTLKPKPSLEQISTSEMAGNDWGNTNDDICGEPDGGLFYSIGCSTIEMLPKSCINLSRICEFGVSLDETKQVPDLEEKEKLKNSDEDAYMTLVPDGFVSKDELYNDDERSMFATMNGNELRTKLNTENGLKEYDFRHIYVDNFDNSLALVMENRQRSCRDYTYGANYNLERFSRGYYDFRMGRNNYFYDGKDSANQGFTLPRYENSFYFYFGLKVGKTAIDKFNSQFFAECYNSEDAVSPIGVYAQANNWCSDNETDGDGFLKIDLSNISLPCRIMIQDNNDLSDTGEYHIINSDGGEDIDIEKIVLGDNTEGGYTKVNAVHGSSREIVSKVKNGSYTITITDVDEEIYSIDVTMMYPFLRYDTEVTPFKVAENTLLLKYGTYGNIEVIDGPNWPKEITDKDYVRVESDGNELGGTIAVYNVSDGRNGEAISFKVIIESINEIPGYNNPEHGNKYYKEKYYPAKGNCEIEDVTFKTVLLFGVPKGDEKYKITVIEQCCNLSEEEWRNKYTKTVTVPNPTPYKLYINGTVDYDVINDWDSGYRLSGAAPSDGDDINVGNGGTFSDNWLNISDETRYHWEKSIPYKNSIDNINKVVKIIKNNSFNFIDYIDINEFKNKIYFNGLIDTIEGFKNADGSYKTEYQNIASECDTILFECQNIIDYRESFIVAMKDAFWLTCPSEEKDLYFSATTDDMPVKFHIAYRTERAVSGENKNIFEYTDQQNKLTYFDDSYRMEGISIPTISTVDSERFGGGLVINGKVSWAKDNYSIEKGCKDGRRYANFVSVINNAKITIPVSVTDSNKVSEYFGFHIIDKIMNINYIAWSCITGIPYYKPYDELKIGKAVSMYGLFAGKILNGVTQYSRFKTQKVGMFDMDILTINGEDEMPTERYIVDDLYNNANTYENKKYHNFKNYIVETNHDGGEPHEYVPLMPRTVNMELQDINGCQIVEEIFGGMNIVLDSESVNNCKNKKLSVFNVGVENGPGNNVTYYVYKFNNSGTYPLNFVSNSADEVIDVASFPYNNVMDYEIQDKSFRNDIKYAFAFATKNDDLSSRKTNQLYSHKVDEFGTEQEDASWGYGNTGEFKNDDGIYGEYYVISRTENECRAISPVYAYVDVYGSVVIGVAHTKIEESSKPEPEPGPEPEPEPTPEPEEPAESRMMRAATRAEGDESGDTGDDTGGDDGGGSTFKEIDNNVVGFYIVNAAPNSERGFEGLYYLNNFEYELTGTCELDPIHVINDTAIIPAALNNTEMNALFIAVDDDMYEILQNYITNGYNEDGDDPLGIKRRSLANVTNITVIDKVTLKHITCISTDKRDMYKDEWNAVTYRPNGGYWRDETDINDETDIAYRTKFVSVSRTESYGICDFFGVPYPTHDMEANGYYFAGWYEIEDEATLYKCGVDTITNDGPKIFVAKWVGPTSIIWQADGENQGHFSDGTTEYTQDLADEEIGTPQSCPLGEPENDQEGWVFDGWECVSDCTGVIIDEDGNVTTDHTCTVKAKWLKQWTVRWIDEDGEPEPPAGKVNITFNVANNNGKWSDNTTDDYIMQVDKNSSVSCDKIAISQQPLLYGFVGWNTLSIETTGVKTINVAESDITVYAIFKSKDCEVVLKDVSTGTDNISLEVQTLSGASGTHFEWVGFTGNCTQNMVDGQGTLECNGITSASKLRLYVADSIFYVLNGNDYFADIYKNNGWHIDEYNAKLQDYNICYTKDEGPEPGTVDYIKTYGHHFSYGWSGTYEASQIYLTPQSYSLSDGFYYDGGETQNTGDIYVLDTFAKNNTIEFECYFADGNAQNVIIEIGNYSFSYADDSDFTVRTGVADTVTSEGETININVKVTRLNTRP